MYGMYACVRTCICTDAPLHLVVQMLFHIRERERERARERESERARERESERARERESERARERERERESERERERAADTQTGEEIQKRERNREGEKEETDFSMSLQTHITHHTPAPSTTGTLELLRAPLNL